MSTPHPSGLTCNHAEIGLCPQCQADYDEAPSDYTEFGSHPIGEANWQRFVEDLAAEAAAERAREAELAAKELAEPAPANDGDEIPF